MIEQRSHRECRSTGSLLAVNLGAFHGMVYVADWFTAFFIPLDSLVLLAPVVALHKTFYWYHI